MGLLDDAPLPWLAWEPENYGKDKKYPGKESALQASCYKLAKYLPGDPIVFHVANERRTNVIMTSTGRKISPAGSALKAQGVVAGIPDLVIASARGPFHGLVVELKVKGGRLSPEQRRQLWRFDREGWMTALVWNIDGMREVLDIYVNG